MNHVDLLQTFILYANHENTEIQPITDGHINTTLLMTVQTGISKEKYILQKINKQVFKNPQGVMNSIAVVNKHLAGTDYPLERLEFLKNDQGKFLTTDAEGDYWRVSPFIAESYTVTKVEDRAQALESAQTLSLYYSYILDIDPSQIEPSIPGFTDFAQRIENYNEILRHASEARKEQAKAEIDFVNAHLSLPKKFIENQKNGNFPTRVIHADPKISNILFDKNTGKGKSVIDLDTLMPATILYDFGDMIRSYTNLKEEDDPTPGRVFSSEYFTAVKEGFLTHTSKVLTDAEKDNLDYAGKVVIYIQALRFLADFLNNDQYYHTDYPEHNLDRTRNQINLLKGLMEFVG